MLKQVENCSICVFRTVLWHSTMFLNRMMSHLFPMNTSLNPNRVENRTKNQYWTTEFYWFQNDNNDRVYQTWYWWNHSVWSFFNKLWYSNDCVGTSNWVLSSFDLFLLWTRNTFNIFSQCGFQRIDWTIDYKLLIQLNMKIWHFTHKKCSSRSHPYSIDLRI